MQVQAQVRVDWYGGKVLLIALMAHLILGKEDKELLSRILLMHKEMHKFAVMRKSGIN